MDRNEKGQFIKGRKLNKAWYEAMARRTGENHKMWKTELHKTEMIECACGCGEFFNKYDDRGRERKYIHNHFAKELGTVYGQRDHVEKATAANRGRKLKRDDEYKTPENKRERHRFRRETQMKVFERDDFTCQICGVRGGILHVDHIQSWAMYPELRFEMDNCRTVCMACHYYITFKRKLPKNVIWGAPSQSHKNI